MTTTILCASCALQCANNINFLLFFFSLGQLIDSLGDATSLCHALQRTALIHSRRNIYKNHVQVGRRAASVERGYLQNLCSEFMLVLRNVAGDAVTPEVVAAWTLLFDLFGNIIGR